MVRVSSSGEKRGIVLSGFVSEIWQNLAFRPLKHQIIRDSEPLRLDSLLTLYAFPILDRVGEICPH